MYRTADEMKGLVCNLSTSDKLSLHSYLYNGVGDWLDKDHIADPIEQSVYGLGQAISIGLKIINAEKDSKQKKIINGIVGSALENCSKVPTTIAK